MKVNPKIFAKGLDARCERKSDDGLALRYLA